MVKTGIRLLIPFGASSLFGPKTCAIITTVPHDDIAHTHDHMPVILNPDVCESWLDRETTPEAAVEIMNQNLGADLVAHRTGTAVNKNSVQGPELIKPLPENAS